MGRHCDWNPVVDGIDSQVYTVYIERKKRYTVERYLRCGLHTSSKFTVRCVCVVCLRFSCKEFSGAVVVRRGGNNGHDTDFGSRRGGFKT